MSKNPSVPRVTRKQESRAHHERQMRLRIRIAAAAVAVLVVGVIAFGFIDQYVLQPARPVATVNGVKISTTEFEKQVKYDRMQMIQQYWQLQSYAQFFGADQFQSQISQITSSLNAPQTVGQQALDDLAQLGDAIRQLIQEASIRSRIGHHPLAGIIYKNIGRRLAHAHALLSLLVR